MGDVTALVLSVGEEYTDRAVASVRRQTLPVAETIIVRGISPFHRALNTGAARVRTPFFIQVDADMILDDTCIEDLRDSMVDGVGIVYGRLRDPLLGRIVGIKLFRTRCFEQVQLRDSLSPETDFAEDMQRAGWTRIDALKYIGGPPAGWHVFGEHRPDYNPHYTFCKYMVEGAKARYRKAGGGLRNIFRQLHTSGHSAATIAAIAAAHGIFVKEERDLQGPYTRNEEVAFLEQFLKAQEADEDVSTVLGDLVHRDWREGFTRSYELGIRLRRHQTPSVFKTCMKQLGQEGSIASWVALVGMCHGLFVDKYYATEAEGAFVLLRDLLPR